MADSRLSRYYQRPTNEDIFTRLPRKTEERCLCFRDARFEQIGKKLTYTTFALNDSYIFLFFFPVTGRFSSRSFANVLSNVPCQRSRFLSFFPRIPPFGSTRPQDATLCDNVVSFKVNFTIGKPLADKELTRNRERERTSKKGGGKGGGNGGDTYSSRVAVAVENHSKTYEDSITLPISYGSFSIAIRSVQSRVYLYVKRSVPPLKTIMLKLSSRTRLRLLKMYRAENHQLNV